MYQLTIILVKAEWSEMPPMDTCPKEEVGRFYESNSVKFTVELDILKQL